MWRKEHLQQITATRICKYFHTHNYLCQVSSTQLPLRGETKIFVECSYSTQRTRIYSCRCHTIPCFLGFLPTASLSQTSARITRDARLFLPVPLLCHWFRLRSSLSTAVPNPFTVVASFPSVFPRVLGRQRAGMGNAIQPGYFFPKVTLTL